MAQPGSLLHITAGSGLSGRAVAEWRDKARSESRLERRAAGLPATAEMKRRLSHKLSVLREGARMLEAKRAGALRGDSGKALGRSKREIIAASRAEFAEISNQFRSKLRYDVPSP